jgi:hypothetical protein
MLLVQGRLPAGRRVHDEGVEAHPSRGADVAQLEPERGHLGSQPGLLLELPQRSGPGGLIGLDPPGHEVPVPAAGGRALDDEELLSATHDDDDLVPSHRAASR